MQFMLILILAVASVKSNPLTSRIAGGSEASVGQFPHAVSLTLGKGDGKAYICGASIIHESWLLTAGHCLLG